MPFQNDHVSVTNEAGYTLVRFLGDLDMQIMMKVRPPLEEEAKALRGPVFIDLSAVEFLDSSAVNLLALFFQSAQRAHQQMAILGAGDQPSAVIEMVGLSDYVPLLPDLVAAKAALKIRA